MKLNYFLLDVFTDKRLAGNQLAIVTNSDGLLDNEMQAIAGEFNLSETVFLRKARGERNTAELRIFTPKVELPFAGHPTVGAAVLLGLQSRATAVRLEEQVGLITALVERIDKRTGEARFGLPRLPSRVGRVPASREIALALGIEVEAVGCGVLQPALFSAGHPFYLVPVVNAAVLKQIQPNLGRWAPTFPEGRHSAYIFTETPDEPANDYAARMMSPGLGLAEDPGTGAAAAALIGLLAEHSGLGTGQADLVLRQGHEMGRPCRIVMQFKVKDETLVHGAIGGRAVIVGEGLLDLEDL